MHWPLCFVFPDEFGDEEDREEALVISSVARGHLDVLVDDEVLDSEEEVNPSTYGNYYQWYPRFSSNSLPRNSRWILRGQWQSSNHICILFPLFFLGGGAWGQ